jgi:hypothetical protein
VLTRFCALIDGPQDKRGPIGGRRRRPTRVHAMPALAGARDDRREQHQCRRHLHLQRLVFRRVGFREGTQLEVGAPNLYYLALDNCGERSVPVTVTAPMLAELIWNHEYAPGRHRIEEADRQIYRLVVTYGPNTFNSLLLGRFDAVDELCLNLSMPLVSARFLFDRSFDIVTIRSSLLMEIVIEFEKKNCFDELVNYSRLSSKFQMSPHKIRCKLITLPM